MSEQRVTPLKLFDLVSVFVPVGFLDRSGAPS